jgi:hypothetical protein
VTFHIAIPVWGAPYIDLAIRHTIPSLLAALGEREASIIVYTDAPARFATAFGSHAVDCRPAPFGPGGHHGAQARSHRDALATAPAGAVVMLMNADVVVSADTFSAAAELLRGNIKVIAALGLRCLIGGSAPPIGVDARTLLRWSWENLHPSNKDCVWGRGRTGIPTLLLFEGATSVTARCFHLHPIFLRKDRDRAFRGTIDDDLLAQYAPDEIHFAGQREMAFAELSPANKVFQQSGELTVARVVKFGERRFSAAHLRAFMHSIRILGDDDVDERPADVIAAKIEEARMRGIAVPPPRERTLRR